MADFSSDGYEKQDQESKLRLHPDHLTESALWAAFKDGDEKALAAMYDRFTGPLFNYGYKVLPETETVKDAIQELFIELWKRKASLSDTDSIKYYLFKSLRRKLTRIKGKLWKSGKSLEGTVEPFQSSHEHYLIDQQVSGERRSRIIEMLDQLTPRQREAIFLRYFEELSYEQIAYIMELGKQAVYNHIHSGFKSLKRSLKPDRKIAKN